MKVRFIICTDLACGPNTMFSSVREMKQEQLSTLLDCKKRDFNIGGTHFKLVLFDSASRDDFGDGVHAEVTFVPNNEAGSEYKRTLRSALKSDTNWEG